MSVEHSYQADTLDAVLWRKQGHTDRIRETIIANPEIIAQRQIWLAPNQAVAIPAAAPRYRDGQPIKLWE